MGKSPKLFVFVLYYLRDLNVKYYKFWKSCMDVVLIKSNKKRKKDNLLV